VKAFGQEDVERERFSLRSGAGVLARVSLAWAEGWFGLLVNLVTALGTAAVLFIGVRHVQSGALTLGELLLVVAYLSQLYSPLKTISRKAASVQTSLASAERVFEFLDEPVDVRQRRDARPLTRATGLVELDHVSMAYDGGPTVLDDVSVRVEPGMHLGIRGVTGAGKTTLVSLIPRFYDASVGRVTIDGTDVRKYKVRSLRERISIVLQDPMLFQGTIADNIRYGRLDATREQIEQAARDAHAHDFIARLPRGYDTEVAEAGGGLSGGERQRLSIARAILKDAPILILDEPTSSLDAISEEIVFTAIRGLRAGRTTIVIAHRLSTVRDADRILVLDGGQIAAQGRHEELLEKSDLYRRMCARLSVGKSLDDPETVDELIEAAKR